MAPRPRRLLTPLLTTVVTLALLGPLASLGATSASAAGQSAQASYAGRTHALVNDRRADHRVGSLRRSECLRRSAQQQAQRMADQRRLFHQDLGAVSRRCGLRTAGENVAAGYPTPAAAVRGWMRSSGHRANILRRGYRIAGVGAVQRRRTWYVAQVFGRSA